jgi:Ser/Thr protein kinase RdoA (MazF antagonist)
MNELLREKLRETLLDCYGMDINEAEYSYSTQNYAFIFPGQTHMIRVSMTSKKTRKEIMSEMFWIDDLKQFKQTICEPNVSLKGNLLEEFEIDGQTYRAGMFRTARGKVELIGNTTPMLFICVGDLMGTIHHVSTNERELGIRYQRKTLAEQFADYKERSFSKLSLKVQERINGIEAQVNALSKDLGFYGICHGDFHHHNFFVEANNVWLFDFDSCCYAHYLYDAASFIQACFLHGYKTGEDCRQVLYKDILPYLKIGYELNKDCPENYWDNLELFIAYRTAYTLMALQEVEDCGLMDINKVRQFFSVIMSYDDILDGMTKALSYKANVTA